MTDPADPHRSVDPNVSPLPPTAAVEPVTSEWSRPDVSVSTPPASGPPEYPATLPVPYPRVPYPPAPVTYPTAPADYLPYQTYPSQSYPQQYVVMGGPGYAVDPITGQPYSAKSKVVAGLLQLLPGFLFSLGGIGRLYAGNTTIGVIQIAATLVGWTAFWCGILLNVFVLFIPLFLYGLIWLWFVIDGVVMLAGRPVDGQGWPLRP